MSSSFTPNVFPNCSVAVSKNPLPGMVADYGGVAYLQGVQPNSRQTKGVKTQNCWLNNLAIFLLFPASNPAPYGERLSGNYKPMKFKGKQKGGNKNLCLFPLLPLYNVIHR